MTLRVTIAAPFEPDQSFGGSQRVTSVRERLEEREIVVRWITVAGSRLSPADRIGRIVRGKPRAGYAAPPDVATGADVVVVAHSYIAEAVLAACGSVPLVLDFVDLEHRGWGDEAAALPWSLRRAAWTVEAAVMGRYERRLLQTFDAAMFTCAEEVQWAGANDCKIPALTVPNVLPRQFEEEATAIAHQREANGGQRSAGYYMGSLDHSPNARALLSFLTTHWPRIRDRWPALRLMVAGRTPPELARRLREFPGVEAHGYVEHPGALMRTASFALMPFGNRAGTSLRVLYYALAGLPLIGSPLAFRGLTPRLGTPASSPNEWLAGIADALDVQTARALMHDAEAAARAIQADPTPWDRLARLLHALRPGSSA